MAEMRVAVHSRPGSEVPTMEWWQQFFPGLYVHVQQRDLDPGRAVREAQFIARLLRLRPGARVLDVPCGIGRHAIELAARGFQVTALDSTTAALEAGRQQAAVRGVTIQWHEGDMRDLPWHQEFDGASCFFGSFGYFDEAGNLAFLEAVFAALRPGAWFVLETHIAETLLPRFQPQAWNRVGPYVLTEQRRYDPQTRRIETDWTWSGGGQTLQQRSSIRIYSFDELAQLFAQAGFTSLETYDTETQLPFQPNAFRLTLAARKPG